jgi:SMI1 / KNR4 family (SUKH-1)
MSFWTSLVRFLGLDVDYWSKLGRAAPEYRPEPWAPMDSEALVRVEAILHLTLPESYRTIMLSCSPIDPGLELQLEANPNRIILENLELRRDGFADMNWAEHYLWIGGDGAGNAYFLDLSQEGAPVFFADHEVQQYVQQAVDFPTWFRSEGLATLLMKVDQSSAG